MKSRLVPSFVVTVALASACGGSTPATDTPEEDRPMPVNPPGPDGEPGIGDGAGPPPDLAEGQGGAAAAPGDQPNEPPPE